MKAETRDALAIAKALLDENERGAERPLCLTRYEAEVWFGKEAVASVPDREVTRVCGKPLYIVGDRWPKLW